MAQQDMIYRRLDSNGDYTFGQGSGNFYVNSREGVAQAVKTRLGLIAGEWFLDTTAGTPYNSQILGAGMLTKYNPAIQAVILETKGVLRITEYSSFVDSATRKATIVATIDTIYGSITLTHNL